jgi:hypothetical protein
MARKLILFELNEVPLRIVDEFCARRPASCLARLLPRCRQFETYAADAGHLSPWITWPTVHRGVSNEKHLITSFGEDLSELDRRFPPIWSLLARQGVSTGIFGSLHSYPLPADLENYAFYVPDTFAAGSECFPKAVSAFQDFNLTMARASARNVDTRVPWRQALRLLANLPALGFKPGTLLRMGGQLAAERIQPWRRTRRRTCQVVLAFDVFMKQIRRTKPAFATFFTNHVASSMHRYWAAAFPGDYDRLHVERGWIRTYGSEIDYTMSVFDRFLARMVKFIERDRDYALLVATSMGQAATTARHIERQLYITNLPKFMRALSVESGQWSQRPAMAPDTCVVVEATRAAAFQAALESVCIDGRPIDVVAKDNGFFQIRLGQTSAAGQSPGVVLTGQARSLSDLGLSNVDIDDRAGCTAYHVPQGSLLIFDPRADAKPQPRTQISTLDVAPFILSYFGASVPGHMQRPALKAA